MSQFASQSQCQCQSQSRYLSFCVFSNFFIAAADLCCLPEYVSDYLQWCSPGVFYHQCWRTLLVVRNGCVMLLFVGGLVWRHILNAERNQKLYYISRHMPQQLSGAVLENAAALVVISFMWSMKYLLPLISLRWSRTGKVSCIACLSSCILLKQSQEDSVVPERAQGLR